MNRWWKYRHMGLSTLCHWVSVSWQCSSDLCVLELCGTTTVMHTTRRAFCPSSHLLQNKKESMVYVTVQTSTSKQMLGDRNQILHNALHSFRYFIHLYITLHYLQWLFNVLKKYVWQSEEYNTTSLFGAFFSSRDFFYTMLKWNIKLFNHHDFHNSYFWKYLTIFLQTSNIDLTHISYDPAGLQSEPLPSQRIATWATDRYGWIIFR